MFSQHLPAKARDQENNNKGESKERNTLDINLEKKHNLRHNKPQSYCLELPFVISLLLHFEQVLT